MTIDCKKRFSIRQDEHSGGGESVRHRCMAGAAHFEYMSSSPLRLAPHSDCMSSSPLRLAPHSDCMSSSPLRLAPHS
eukprot:7834470-Pyramimonas_sp.AAC.2